MGYYINPENMSKEEWVLKYSIRSNGRIPPKSHTEVNEQGVLCVWVCIIDNIMFTAAGICVSAGELQAFAHSDGRAKRWYLIPFDRLTSAGFIEREDIVS